MQLRTNIKNSFFLLFLSIWSSYFLKLSCFTWSTNIDSSLFFLCFWQHIFFNLNCWFIIIILKIMLNIAKLFIRHLNKLITQMTFFLFLSFQNFLKKYFLDKKILSIHKTLQVHCLKYLKFFFLLKLILNIKMNRLSELNFSPWFHYIILLLLILNKVRRP